MFNGMDRKNKHLFIFPFILSKVKIGLKSSTKMFSTHYNNHIQQTKICIHCRVTDSKIYAKKKKLKLVKIILQCKLLNVTF